MVVVLGLIACGDSMAASNNYPVLEISSAKTGFEIGKYFHLKFQEAPKGIPFCVYKGGNVVVKIDKKSIGTVKCPKKLKTVK